MSPATLVFEGVWDLEGDLDFKGMYIVGYQPVQAIDLQGRVGREDLPLWHMKGMRSI